MQHLNVHDACHHALIAQAKCDMQLLNICKITDLLAPAPIDWAIIYLIYWAEIYQRTVGYFSVQGGRVYDSKLGVTCHWWVTHRIPLLHTNLKLQALTHLLHLPGVGRRPWKTRLLAHQKHAEGAGGFQRPSGTLLQWNTHMNKWSP